MKHLLVILISVFIFSCNGIPKSSDSLENHLDVHKCNTVFADLKIKASLIKDWKFSNLGDEFRVETESSEWSKLNGDEKKQIVRGLLANFNIICSHIL